MKLVRIISLMAFVLVSLASMEAFGGGLFVPLGGVLNTGRAGAGVVSTRDPNAIAYNPALIALGDGHQLLVDFEWAMLQLEFQRASQVERNGSVTEFEKVKNEAPGILIPQILFTTDFGTDQFGLGVGVFPPNAAPAKFPADGPQRYAVIDMANTIAFTTELAFAWRPHPRFSIGAGIQNVTFIFKGTGISSTYFGVLSRAEDPDMDSVITVDAADYFTPSANFGIWAEPVDGFELGVSFQLFADMKSRNGKIKSALPNHYLYERTTLVGEHVDMTISLPWSLKFGLRYRHGDVFDIEVDGWFTRWSRQKSIDILTHDVWLRTNALVDDVHVGNFNIPRDMKDVGGVSIGADWHVLPKQLTVRAGFLYESGSTRDDMYSCFEYDNHKFAPTIGLSYTIDLARIDFAFAHVHQLPKTVTNGTFKQYNLVYPEGAAVTNNGKYKSYYDFIGLGVNLTFH
ncbi:MAG: outer membrane protein transport protein [Proteobacteria bacterium]|nr:outer membrane protein transport protein [Pseudomonadota bacterium]